MLAAAVLAGIANGNIQAVSAAALSGASSAVELCLAIAGPICLWSGVMELSRECGGSALLGRLLKAPLASLFTSVKDIPEVMNKISANISANILGLGNAATPLGMAAAAEAGQALRKRQSLKGAVQPCGDKHRLASDCAEPPSPPSGRTPCPRRLTYCRRCGYRRSRADRRADRLRPLRKTVAAVLPPDKMKGVLEMTALIIPVFILVMAAACKGQRRLFGLYQGARDGLVTIVKLFPILCGLLCAVSMLRASGIFDTFSALLQPVLERFGHPRRSRAAAIRPFSGSGALLPPPT